ncbi:DUF7344 domain-containing protein [Haladaptatus caseinilyticus]|uniref:DUF7344 domain-containing protein n=1 Tax=Haladaptatus caseinilyticus TaxID=2993314 RepID=UPI00224B9E0D|nr:hypothetical protein [Haladaptatus caseinilyticus]
MKTGKSTNSGHPSEEEAVDLLRHEHRRAIITYLDQKPIDCASFGDLVECIISSGSKRETTLDERREQVAIGLLHNHLPRLADADVLEYDQRSETVRYWGDSRFESILETANNAE